MTKLDVGFAESESWVPTLGEWYRIRSATFRRWVFSGEQRQGVTVTVVGRDQVPHEYTVSVYGRARRNSRLGQHVLLLGDDTDTWVGAYLRYTKFERGGNGVVMEVSRTRPAEDDIPSPLSFDDVSAEKKRAPNVKE